MWPADSRVAQGRQSVGLLFAHLFSGLCTIRARAHSHVESRASSSYCVPVASDLGSALGDPGCEEEGRPERINFNVRSVTSG